MSYEYDELKSEIADLKEKRRDFAQNSREYSELSKQINQLIRKCKTDHAVEYYEDLFTRANDAFWRERRKLAYDCCNLDYHLHLDWYIEELEKARKLRDKAKAKQK